MCYQGTTRSLIAIGLGYSISVIRWITWVAILSAAAAASALEASEACERGGRGGTLELLHERLSTANCSTSFSPFDDSVSVHPQLAIQCETQICWTGAKIKRLTSLFGELAKSQNHQKHNENFKIMRRALLLLLDLHNLHNVICCSRPVCASCAGRSGWSRDAALPAPIIRTITLVRNSE